MLRGFVCLAGELPLHCVVILHMKSDLEQQRALGHEVVMKSHGMGKFGILILALASALSLGAWAQTTNDGPGPSEQPDAPLETGQAQPSQDDQGMPAANPDDAQPTEAQPGGPSG